MATIIHQMVINARRKSVFICLAYQQVLKKNEEDPGFPGILKQAQDAWEKYATAQLFCQFPLREEEEKVLEVIYGPS